MDCVRPTFTGRSQAVYDRVRDVVSAFALVNDGEPQGSVLSPLLFSLYLTDIKYILRHCKYNFYTDDLLVYLHCEPKNLLQIDQIVI